MGKMLRKEKTPSEEILLKIMEEILLEEAEGMHDSVKHFNSDFYTSRYSSFQNLFRLHYLLKNQRYGVANTLSDIKGSKGKIMDDVLMRYFVALDAAIKRGEKK